MTDLREKHILHELNSCVHFNGVGQIKCKAGVVYHELLGNGPGCFANLPCLKDDKAEVKCDKVKFPTREEAEAKTDEWMKRVERSRLCITAAHADAKAKGFGKGHGGVSLLPCPSGCGGELRYSVASYNGHMHAKCSTKGCVSWME